MLVNFNGMLRKAQHEKYAVGAFNVYNYETMKGVLLAASELRQPVILAFGAKYLSNMSLRDAASMAKTLAEESGAEICLHLDHCSDIALIFRAIQAGFSSVMYDGSALPFEKNLANTERVCEAAHACGVSVEAELGSIAAGENSHEGSAADIEAYTSPQAAGDFAASSGCDALAVSMGTVHGLYKNAPNIRLDLLAEIRKRVEQPLVLHGGSGIPQETIRRCIDGGICKINVNTEISMYAVEKTAELLKMNAQAPHLAVLAEQQRQFVREAALKYMRFFGKN
ncbi:MAG: class II fructose-bisphosphate aldolase [Spirochaetaceae bacterium]|jgi:fructose-bisphosphate aldolase class II|nr:class II fructose-bisphosphate aldolase [Spirochaetaceae bacterium]